MYTIAAIVNGVEYPIHNPKSRRLIVGDPWFEVGDNINGSAEFTVYPEHPFFDRVHKLTTEIVIRNDGAEEFRGRVLYDDEDFSGSKKVVCEGELAYLCDSIQRPKVYHNTSVSDYLADLLTNHNNQVEARKQFQRGIVTVVDSNDSLYRYSNWNSTRECLSDKLVDRLGGHLVVRWSNGVRYLDYLADNEYYHAANQKIEFGRNLLDFAKNADATDLATCIIPLGAKQEEEASEDGESNSDTNLDNRLTIESVNNGVDYVFDSAAVQEYGKIFKTIVNDDITTASYLKSWGEEYLQSSQFEKLVLEVKAIDLGLQDTGIQRFTLGHRIHCVSTPNGMDTWLPVATMRTYLMRMEENTLTLGTSGTMITYTSSNRSTTAELERSIKAIPPKAEIVQDALDKAQALFNAQLQNGYVHYLDNELVISDNATLSESTKMWRWGLGGLAYSSDGETFKTAWTMDGAFDADFITTGTLTSDVIAANSIEADKLKVESLSAISADVGTLTAGILQSKNYKSGVSGMQLDLTNGTADITGKITATSFTINGSELSSVATSGSYDSLSDCPTPASTYITEIGSGGIQVHAANVSGGLSITSSYLDFIGGDIWGFKIGLNDNHDLEIRLRDTTEEWDNVLMLTASRGSRIGAEYININCGCEIDGGLSVSGDIYENGDAISDKYAEKGHTHSQYASASHTHSGYASDMHSHSLFDGLYLASGYIYTYYSSSVSCGIIRPTSNGSGRVGTADYKFDYVQAVNIYANGTSVTSDRKLKSHVADLSVNDIPEMLIYNLKPSLYKFKDKSTLDDRLHFGFYAQDVFNLMCKLYPDDDFGITTAILKDSGEAETQYDRKCGIQPDENLSWSLSYTEIIAPLVAVVQKQKSVIDSLVRRMNAIESQC